MFDANGIVVLKLLGIEVLEQVKIGESELVVFDDKTLQIEDKDGFTIIITFDELKDMYTKATQVYEEQSL